MITNNIDQNGLNDEQREAVVSENTRILVLAGAGSGKTKTLLQKISFLVEEKRVNPSSILAITFTKNAAYEMIDRLILSSDISGNYQSVIAEKRKKKIEEKIRLAYRKKIRWIDALTINTFHGFCYYVLRNYGVNEFDNKFRILKETSNEDTDEFSGRTAPEKPFDILHKLIIEECNDPDFLLSLKRYILDYYVDQIQLEKKPEINGYSDSKYFTTLDGTQVRSKSEQFIADWLYRHNIEYEYEPRLNVSDFDFHPDFYLPQADLYIEHISNKSYPTKDKEKQFERGGLRCVVFHEDFTKNSALFNSELDRIVKSYLPKDYDYTAARTYTEEFNNYHENIKHFIKQTTQIINILKSENISLKSILRKAERDPHERVRYFYKLTSKIITKYTEYCINKSYLDYNDLITRSISLFEKYSDIIGLFRKRYKYILVDEFQDVNNLQVRLIKLLLTTSTQLFCVGDDWQSIYGFRGSNVKYIIEFEKHFPNSKIIKFIHNYRNTTNIAEISNSVIKHNKFKADKDIRALKKSEEKAVVYLGNNIEDNIQFCFNTVNELLLNGIDGKDILFLYRRNKMFLPYQKFFSGNAIKVEAKTIHSAKGLEAKVVFIIGLSEGYGGFPDIWLEDRIFQIIKTVNYDLLLEEERRLFYVAITRAKENLFLITEKGNESSFLKEIPEELVTRLRTSLYFNNDSSTRTCSHCGKQLAISWQRCPFCTD